MSETRSEPLHRSCSMGYPVAKIPAAKIRQFLEAIEPEVIIECPACQTKFRIEASKLAAETPTANRLGRSKARFHCSRCDYVFSAEVATSSVMNHSGNTVQSEIEEDSVTATSHLPAPHIEEPSPQFNVDFDDLNYNPPAPEMPSKIEFEKPAAINTGKLSDQQQLAFNFGSVPSNTIRASETIPPESANQNPVTMAEPIFIENASPPTNVFQSTEALEDKDNVEQDLFTTKNESTSPSWLDQSNTNTDFSNFHIEPSAIYGEVPGVSEVEATRVVDDLPASLAEYKYSSPVQTTIPSTSGQTPEDYSRYALDYSQREQDPNVDFANKAIDTGFVSNNLFSSSSGAQTANSSNSFRTQGMRKKGNTNFTALAVLTLPLLIGLSLLGATTLYLGKNLSASEKLLTSIFPKAQRETPSGVFVQQPKLEAMVLDSGDIVNVVTGTIVNQSKKILTSLTIEGLGFSDSGIITTSEKVLVGNPISINNATLKTLTPSNIKELQSKEPKSFILRPDAKTKFTLVFTKPVKAKGQSINSDIDGNMSSFAVRVYSARFRGE